jgi:hypothetical protein
MCCTRGDVIAFMYIFDCKFDSIDSISVQIPFRSYQLEAARSKKVSITNLTDV